MQLSILVGTFHAVSSHPVARPRRVCSAERAPVQPRHHHNRRDAFRHALFGATVNDNACAFGSERSGDGETNAGGGAGDQGGFILELQVHGRSGCVFCPALTRQANFADGVATFELRVRSREDCGALAGREWSLFVRNS